MQGPKTAARKSLSTKVEFSLWVILALSLTILTLTWSTLRYERGALTAEVTRRGIALAQYVAAHSLDPFLTDDKLSLATLVADVMKNPDMVYALIIDRNGRVIAADRSELVGKPYQRPPGDYPLDRPQARAYTWTQAQGGRVIDIGIPLILQAKTKIGEVHLGVSQSTIDKVVAGAWGQVTGWAAFFLLASLAGSILLVRLMLQPVSELAKGAQAIGNGDLDYRIPVMRRNELGQLTETFNRMTGQLKVATANAIEQEKIKKELQLAHQIQRRLLPKQTPQVKGFSFNALYRAAKEVGGDYYDFIWLGKDRLGMAVADVCGKGVPAAMLMSVARSMLRSIAPNSPSPAQTVRELNRLLHDDLQAGMFITLFYAVIDIPKKVMTYTSAGHNPALLWHSADNQFQSLELDLPCLPLGVRDGELFDTLVKEKKVSLAANDIVLLFTDGVTEAMNAQSQQFGDEGLQAALSGQREPRDAQAVIQRLDEQLNQFCGDVSQSDDIAVIAMKVD